MKLDKHVANRYNRDGAIKKFLEDNNSVWSANTELVATMGDYGPKYVLFGVLIGAHTLDKSGLKKIKNDAREALQLRSFTLCSAASGWAAGQKKWDVHAQVDIPRSGFKRPDAVLANYCAALKDAVAAQLPGLTTVTTAQITQWGDLIHTFEVAESIVRLGTTDQTTTTKNIRDTDHALSAMIDQRITPLVNSYLETNPDFVTGYQNALKIVDLGIRHEPATPPAPPAPTP